MFGIFESIFLFNLPLGFIFMVFFVFLTFYKKMFSTLVVLIMSNITGKVYPFLFFLVSIFYCILVANFFGMIPQSFPLSSLVCLSLFFAFIGWLSNYFYILTLSVKNNLAHFLPLGSPGFLSVFLVWIEVISWLARPLSLGVRLVANITAGHLLIHLMSLGCFYMNFVFFLAFFFFLLELVVAFVQAYVYTLLLSLYVNEGL